jgi:hypothetical protein
MATADSLTVEVRDVTDEEVATFWENGWTSLPGLISEEVTAELLAKAKDLMGEDGTSNELREGVDRELAWWHDYHLPNRDSQLYADLVDSETLGHNAARLLGREMPIRSITNLLLPKSPAGKAKSAATGWHQDFGSTPARCTSIAIWIALDEVTPEMGSMQFYNGSHRFGILEGEPTPERWPMLRDCPLSEPMTLKPGDATAHHNLTVHGAPANTTSKTRWGYVINYFPADAPWNGSDSLHTDPYRDKLEAGKPIDIPEFPVVYSPS